MDIKGLPENLSQIWQESLFFQNLIAVALDTSTLSFPRAGPDVQG